MEEIVTVDGRQFKLTVDRPLTATERAQTLAEIRKQTGCGTCGQPRTANLGSDWQYGGIYGLTVPQTPSTGSCPVGTKKSGDAVTLSVDPTGGVGPYTAWFYLKHSATETGTLITTARLGAATNPITSSTEGITVSRTYTLDDADVAAATGDGAATTPIDVDSGGVLSFSTAVITLSSATLRFITAIRDSCAGGSGPGTCVQWCDVSLACIAPTCNFVVV